MATEQFTYVRGWQTELEEKGWWHSFNLPDGRKIEGLNRIGTLEQRLAQYQFRRTLKRRARTRYRRVGWLGSPSKMEQRGAPM